MSTFVIIALIIINIGAFIIYGIDKLKAKTGAWRIPEATLLGIAFIFGALGAFLGMKVFHHKTKHKQFYIGVPLMLIAQLAIIAVIVIKFFVL